MDGMVTIGGPDSPVGPGSTIGPVAIVKANSVRTPRLLVDRGSTSLAKKRASAGLAEWPRTLFNEANREHARRLARAIDKQGGE